MTVSKPERDLQRTFWKQTFTATAWHKSAGSENYSKDLIFDIYLCRVFSKFFSKQKKSKKLVFTLEVSKKKKAKHPLRLGSNCHNNTAARNGESHTQTSLFHLTKAKPVGMCPCSPLPHQSRAGLSVLSLGSLCWHHLLPVRLRMESPTGVMHSGEGANLQCALRFHLLCGAPLHVSCSTV